MPKPTETKPEPDERRWIVWDPRDGFPRFDADYDPPRCISSGCLGQLTADNVYLTAYAEWLTPYLFGAPGFRRHTDMHVVGEAITARFSLSGSSGVYEVIRVA